MKTTTKITLVNLDEEIFWVLKRSGTRDQLNRFLFLAGLDEFIGNSLELQDRVLAYAEASEAFDPLIAESSKFIGWEQQELGITATLENDIDGEN